MDLQALETHSDTIAKVAVPLILVCWLAYLSVDQFYFFADNEQLISDLETSPPARATNDNLAPVKLSQAALNLFGESGTAPIKVVAAPETRLNLELQGVFTNNNPDLSSAIIAERGKNGELFAIGDRVPGNALLHAVEQDHVLIKRGSRLEKLLFPKQRLSITNTRSASAQTRSQGISSRSTPSRRNSGSTQGASNGRQSGVEPRSEPELRASMLSNPDQTIQDLGFEPLMQGSASGYRVGSSSANPMISQAGLRQGDIIFSVNGMPVGVAANDARLFDQVRSAGRARVEVERNGRRFFLTVPIP
jgi:general secretion pathway protein C